MRITWFLRKIALRQGLLALLHIDENQEPLYLRFRVVFYSAYLGKKAPVNSVSESPRLYGNPRR
jgi:hypothetical protein